MPGSGLFRAEEVWAGERAVNAVFVRRKGAAAGEGLAAIGPSLEAQCELHLQHDPARPACARGLADLFAAAGERDGARRWLGRYRELHAGADAEAERVEHALAVVTLNERHRR
jgi:hypothetical protein